MPPLPYGNDGNAAFVSAGVLTVSDNMQPVALTDELAVEEPLEIRVGHASAAGYRTSNLSITMRTPGADRELAAGFLLSEGIINSVADILSLNEAARPGANMVRVDLAPHIPFNPASQSRHFYTTSSCGVCGKASLAAIAVRGLRPIPRDSLRFSALSVHLLPEQLRRAQAVFNATGGLHACALFNADGHLADIQEDVGRHNALDKLFGRALLSGALPLYEKVVLVSGRASFELVQKCIAAGVSILAAVGAPSSLAVDLAREWDLTLLGFVRNNRYNIYSGEWRIVYEAQNAQQLHTAAAHTE